MTTPTHQTPVSALAEDALGSDDAVALAARVAGGDVHPQELVDASIARAERVNGELNAITVDDFDGARQRANAGHFARDALMAGVPTFFKDACAVEGLPFRIGSRAMPDVPAPEHSPPAAHVLTTGLVHLGITTTPELGLTATTEAALTGLTCNPWDTSQSTGGSSGGSAALVASGVVPIAHGTDGGGSIRLPASCCGLVGLKPSRGRLDADPLPPVIPIDFGVHGVLTRTVRDTATFMAAAEAARPRADLAPVGHVTEPITRRLRIGVIGQRHDGVAYDSTVAAELRGVADGLTALGHEVEEVDSPFTPQLADDFIVLWSFLPFLLWHGGSRAVGEGWDRNNLEPWAQWLIRHFRRNAARAPLVFRRLRRAVENYPRIYARHDVLLCPTMAAPVFPLGYLSPDQDGEQHLRRVFDQVPNTPWHNIGGGPAISLPLAQDGRGLPIGFQFSADVGAEADLLGLALELEQAVGWKDPQVANQRSVGEELT